jgi:[ribosomal protein S5]-alanine N-acetyltransferase
VTVRLAYPGDDLTDGVALLRKWGEADLGCVREASGDPQIPQWTTVPGAFTEAEGLAFIRRQWGRLDDGEGISLALADAATSEAMGLIVLMLHPRRPGVAETGYWVVPRARGRGLATRAIRLASAWALVDVGLARVEALVEPENAASQRALLAAGFRAEGTLRSFLTSNDGRRADAMVFSRIAADL